MKKLLILKNNEWYITRIVFLIAGGMIIASLVLAFKFDIRFLFMTGFIGLMQVIFALTGFCPMVILLDYFNVKCICKKS
jgi:hypothetical protein